MRHVWLWPAYDHSPGILSVERGRGAAAGVSPRVPAMSVAAIAVPGGSVAALVTPLRFRRREPLDDAVTG